MGHAPQAEAVLTFTAGLAVGSALTYFLARRRERAVVAEQLSESGAVRQVAAERSSWTPVGAKPVLGSRHMLRRLCRRDYPIDSEGGVYYNSADAPDWCKGLFSDASQRYA